MLLHGFPGSWWAWRKQTTPLAEAGYHVVVPDLRGYDRGDAPEVVEHYRLGLPVADAVALAGDYGAGGFDLVGHDPGACSLPGGRQPIIPSGLSTP
ncbi:alpha/beta fold hydrolase [Sphingomonas zeicaulis]|uniref:alpha/beta fold hydrolase n=1 Tax=Sphingomonas zeicaulis TaxID=1632740 RepID=UPI003D234DCB